MKESMRMPIGSQLRFITTLFFALAILAGSIIPGPLSQTVYSASAATQQQTPSGSGKTIFLPLISQTNGGSWSMPGANPQRSSWVPGGVKGVLKPLWYKPFQPYIPRKFQVVAEGSAVYIATSSGLFALDANSGAEKWFYPTSMPPGNSPTVQDKVVYVAGYDKKIHAIDADSGARLWVFEAGGGFDTNPLVVDGKVFAGNRDGNFYAVFAQGASAGKLAWKFKTNGPIHFSAAYQGGVVYFASDDSYAYALDSGTGRLVWKSEKLLGAGFQSWWPVVYGDWVIFPGSKNYRTTVEPGLAMQFTEFERNEVYPSHSQDPRGPTVGPIGTQPGQWVSQTPTLDLSKSNATPNGRTVAVTEYFESKPWRRTYFVLNRFTGKEYTTDFDRDGKPEYAPFLWHGTHGGNRYPPVVGGDGVIYMTNNYMSDPYIAGGGITGWKMGSPYISIVSSEWLAVDEPFAYSAAGNMIYLNHCCDRMGAGFDVSVPNLQFARNHSSAASGPGADPAREWLYFSYNVDKLLPGYNPAYYGGTNDRLYEAYGGRNGAYGHHGNQSPPVYHNGKVYFILGNSLVAFASNAGAPVKLPVATATKSASYDSQLPTPDQLKANLENEVRKMLAAGHLRPGYIPTGIFDFRSSRFCGDGLVDYWHNSAETIYTLIRALPHLPVSLQPAVKQYIQNEYTAYPPYQYNHIGWKTGAAREIFTLPPEVQNDLANFPPLAAADQYPGWKVNPFGFYALWKYAQVFGGASQIYQASKAKLDSLPPDAYLAEMPHVHNAFIAGYWGFLELEKLAHAPETSSVRNGLNHLLSLRASSFTKDNPNSYFQNMDLYYCRALSASRNFIFLTPELAQYLHDNAYARVQTAVSEYSQSVPYWFVSKYDSTFGEGVVQHLYDPYAMLQAKALILQNPYNELARYVDVPAVATGDLYYIQNLVSVIEGGNN